MPGYIQPTMRSCNVPTFKNNTNMGRSELLQLRSNPYPAWPDDARSSCIVLLNAYVILMST